MVIRATTTLLFDPAEAFEQASAEILQAYQREVKALMRDAELTLVTGLQDYPPVPNRKIEWESEKQRRYVMALLRRKALAEGREPGDIKYKRTYRLRDGWYVDVSTPSGKVVAQIGNDARNSDGEYYAKFVYGTLDFRSKRISVVPQQRFHAITGWQPAYTTITNWLDNVQADYDVLLNDLFDGFIQSIARRRSR